MEAQAAEDVFTRYAVRMRVRYRAVADERYRPTDGWTRDLSLRGAWVELPEHIATGSALALALAPGDSAPPLVAWVAWSDGHTAPYLHGLRFTGLTGGTRARVRTVLGDAQPSVPRRLYCGFPATCLMRGVGGVPGVLRDLGAGGVGVRLPRVVPPGTRVRVQAATPYGQILADTTVVWSDPPTRLPPGATYRHGLQFLHLDPRSDLPLRALLESLR